MKYSKLYLYLLLPFISIFPDNIHNQPLTKKYAPTTPCNLRTFNGFYLGPDVSLGAVYAVHKGSTNWTGGRGIINSTYSTSQFAAGVRLGYSHTFLNYLYGAIELSSHYLTNSMGYNNSGSYLDNTYFEKDDFSFNWQYGLNGHLGLLVKPLTIVYLIGGLEYLPLNLTQSYRFTNGEQDSITYHPNLLGGLVGLGMGINLGCHWEIRLESTQTFFQKFTCNDVHPPCIDFRTYKLRKALGTLSLIYRF